MKFTLFIKSRYTERNRVMFIKVKREELVADIVNKTFEHNFKFESGAIAKVQLSEANGNLKYVRIYNLIPEVEDHHIENALRDFGKIKKHVQEKFPAALGVDICTGVRGVYMELEKPLPPYMSIGNLRAKFFYQGMTEGCFYCNGTDHIKKDCPKKLTPYSRAQFQEELQQQQQLQKQLQQQQQQSATIPEKPLASEVVKTGFAGNSLYPFPPPPKQAFSSNKDESPAFGSSQTEKTTPVCAENNQSQNSSQMNTSDDDDDDENNDENGMQIENVLEETNVAEATSSDTQHATRRNKGKKSGATRARSNSVRSTRSAAKKVKSIYEMISNSNEN
jgi:hypothetical protein